MKTLIALAFAVGSVFDLQAQQTVTIRETPQQQTKSSIGAPLPFVGTKALLSGQGIQNIHKRTSPLSKQQTEGLEIFVWEDLQCTKNQRFKQLATWLILDQPVEGNYRLQDIEIYAAGFLQRHILTTYDANGAWIDQLESAVSGESAKEGLPLWIKQFRIDPDRTVTIYELKVAPTVPLNFWDRFESLQARRVDTKYKIDSTGHFRKISEICYQPKTYSIAELTDPAKNIWSGTESAAK
ncbi:MAG: hypothetical protein J1E79_04615 [Rikenella sp.]|nr:hypothetical protein [Rikenella sp.]